MYWLVIFELSRGVLYFENWGSYPTHEECIYSLREAEIAINNENQGMACLKDKGAGKPTPKSGVSRF